MPLHTCKKGGYFFGCLEPVSGEAEHCFLHKGQDWDRYPGPRERLVAWGLRRDDIVRTVMQKLGVLDTYPDYLYLPDPACGCNICMDDTLTRCVDEAHRKSTPAEVGARREARVLRSLGQKEQALRSLSRSYIDSNAERLARLRGGLDKDITMSEEEPNKPYRCARCDTKFTWEEIMDPEVHECATLPLEEVKKRQAKAQEEKRERILKEREEKIKSYDAANYDPTQPGRATEQGEDAGGGDEAQDSGGGSNLSGVLQGETSESNSTELDETDESRGESSGSSSTGSRLQSLLGGEDAEADDEPDTQAGSEDSEDKPKKSRLEDLL